MSKFDFTIFHEIYEYFKKVEYNLSDSEAHEAVLADEYHRLHFEEIFGDLSDTPENWAWQKIARYYLESESDVWALEELKEEIALTTENKALESDKLQIQVMGSIDTGYKDEPKSYLLSGYGLDIDNVISFDDKDIEQKYELDEVLPIISKNEEYAFFERHIKQKMFISTKVKMDDGKIVTLNQYIAHSLVSKEALDLRNRLYNILSLYDLDEEDFEISIYFKQAIKLFNSLVSFLIYKEALLYNYTLNNLKLKENNTYLYYEKEMFSRLSLFQAFLKNDSEIYLKISKKNQEHIQALNDNQDSFNLGISNNTKLYWLWSRKLYPKFKHLSEAREANHIIEAENKIFFNNMKLFVRNIETIAKQRQENAVDKEKVSLQGFNPKIGIPIDENNAVLTKNMAESLLWKKLLLERLNQSKILNSRALLNKDIAYKNDELINHRDKITPRDYFLQSIENSSAAFSAIKKGSRNSFIALAIFKVVIFSLGIIALILASQLVNPFSLVFFIAISGSIIYFFYAYWNFKTKDLNFEYQNFQDKYSAKSKNKQKLFKDQLKQGLFRKVKSLHTAQRLSVILLGEY
ncbi:MAG: hypothetical protein GY830_08015 [Bacteroidetes bacterium]|nr:hypothetical protein [Bacteroidota bacterium]